MLVEQIAVFPAVWVSLLVVLGLLVGSFLNVVILRLPRSMEHDWKQQCRELLAGEEGAGEVADSSTPPPNIVYPASHCPQCKTPLKWWHNIPVLSYLLLRGRCYACGGSISLRYPAVEILTAALTLLAGLLFPHTQELPWVLAAVWLLIAMSVIDYDTQLLPDSMTLPLMWLGLIYSVMPESPVSPSDAIIGAAAGYLSLWTIYQVHHRLTGRQGMGYGDFKLLAAAGAWLGWQQLPIVLLLSAASGLLITVALILFRDHDKRKPVPFGPYLAIAFLVALFWGEQLTEIYIRLSGL